MHWNYPWEYIIFGWAWSRTHGALAASRPTLLYRSRCRYLLFLYELLQLFYVFKVFHAWFGERTSGKTSFRHPLLPATIKAQDFITPTHSVSFWLPPEFSLSMINLYDMVFVKRIKSKQFISQLCKWKLIYVCFIIIDWFSCIFTSPASNWGTPLTDRWTDKIIEIVKWINWRKSNSKVKWYHK